MTQKDPALKIHALRKVFGKKVAVNDINLTIPAGSFYGLVGPNGAGKTTTLSMATGLLLPDSGNVHIFGRDVWQDRIGALSQIGLLPDGIAMPERLTGKEMLVYWAILRGLDKQTANSRADELLSALGLANEHKTLIIEYSTGMRKKIGLAAALLHNPRLVVLDEPLEAVDPVSAIAIKKILKEYVVRGGTVVFSSHVMATVEELCDSVAIINKGTVVSSGSLRQVCDGLSLEKRFVALVGENQTASEMAWLTS
jgi:ABC-2 type transport system ATP-binding protein